MADEEQYRAEVEERYTWGEAAAMLEIEYRQIVACAARFTEQSARQRPSPLTPSATEIISHLAVELLPHGPAPSLSDALHALDHLYASWQSEPDAFQRLQARHLAYHLGQLHLLRLALGVKE